MENFKVDISSDNKKSRIVFEGDLTIENIKSIAARLDSVQLNEVSGIYLQKIEFLDLSFLQLLIALIKDLKRKSNASIDLSCDLSEEVQELLEHTGMKEMLTTVNQ